MKLSKFLLTVVFISMFSLLYVYQQTEIFLLAYEGERKEADTQDLLDKNNILRYNINRNASLISIQETISGQEDFQMPESCEFIRLTASLEGKSVAGPSKDKSLLARIFGIKRQAEARTINP